MQDESNVYGSIDNNVPFTLRITTCPAGPISQGARMARYAGPAQLPSSVTSNKTLWLTIDRRNPRRPGLLSHFRPHESVDRESDDGWHEQPTLPSALQATLKGTPAGITREAERAS